MSKRPNKKRRIMGSNRENNDEESPLLAEEEKARRLEDDQANEQEEEVVDMKHLAPISIVDMSNTWPRAIQSLEMYGVENEEFQGPREARVDNPFDRYYMTNQSGHFVWTDQNVVRHGTEVDRTILEKNVYEANVEGFKEHDEKYDLREPSKRFDLKKVQGFGLGLFAKEEIEKGATIGEYTGELINSTEFNWRNLLYVANNQVSYFYCTGTGMTIDANPMGNHTRYINHSCEPNCKVFCLFMDETGLPKVIVTAKRTIKKGEQLFLDYNKEYFENMRCLCETDNCLEKTRKRRRRDSLFQRRPYDPEIWSKRPEERMNKTF